MNNFFKSILLVFLVMGGFVFVTQNKEQKLSPSAFSFLPEKHLGEKGLFVSAKAYTAEESEKFLNKDLLCKGFVPMEIAIQNHTSSTFCLSKRGIDVMQASPKQVVISVTKTTIPRAIAYKVGSLFFWPISFPSFIDSAKVLRRHARLSKDLGAKAVKEREELLLPYSTTQRVFFIKEENFRENFTLTLINQDTEESVDYLLHVQKPLFLNEEKLINPPL